MTTININDLKTAFQYKNDKDLKYTYLIFKILQYPILVKLLGWCANTILKYNLPFKFIIRKTVFKVFCSGENISETFGVIGALGKYNVKSVLDYVSEGEKNEMAFAENVRIIVLNIEGLGRKGPGNFISVKLSGLEDPEYFRSINHKAIDEIKDPKFDRLMKRLDAICLKAFEERVVVYIDAEDRFMQDIIDRMVESMMEKYNKQKAIVFNTLQMYLTDRLSYIEKLVREGEQKNYVPGIKLVRGAYMEKEREEAIKEKRESPVYSSKAETDTAFNHAVDLCLMNHSKVDTCIATHNEQSILRAVECINKYKVDTSSGKVSFSQLYGMSDHLTFNLAAGGFIASKYLPYGEVKKAIPYLIRRSEENSSVNGQVSGEVNRLSGELKRRQHAGKI